MPKVPVYEQQVKAREVQAPGNTQVAPVQDAFGSQVAAAQTRLGEQISKTSDVIHNRLIEIQQRDDDQEVLDRAASFTTELQNAMHNDERDPNGVPLGMLDRELGQVKNMTVEYDGRVGGMQKKYVDSVRGAEQKATLSKLLMSHALSGREQVIQHESRQRELAYDKSFDAVKDSAIAQAGNTTDPTALGVLIRVNAEALTQSMVHRKQDPTEIDYAKRELASKMVENSFNSVLEADPRRAKKILDFHGPAMLGDQRAKLQKALEGKQLYEEQAAIYNRVAGLKAADGFPDEARQQQEVRKLGLSPERTEQIISYVNQRAGEDRQNITRARDGVDRTFTNKVYEAKKGGGSLDNALKMVPTYSYDPTDRAAKEEFIKKLYSGPHETDPVQFIGLWEGIQNKIVSRKDIDTAFLGGYLKPGDWEELRKEHFRMNSTGESPEDKDVRERVKVWADQNIHNKKDRDQFLYTWQEGARGLPPAQKFTYSKELMDKRESGKWYVPNKPEYKVQLQAIDADRTETGNLYKVIGQDEVNSIARGILSTTGKPKWTVADVNAFAKEFGGPDKMVPGTPVHNAIQSLNRHGKLVTPAAVKRALKAKPDGKF